MKTLLLVGVLITLSNAFSFGQCDGKPGPDGLTWNYDEGEREEFSLFRFIGNAFTPDLIKETRRIRAYIRWNAAVMVVRANHRSESVGGHLATYASSAALYEVGFNHFFQG